MLIDTLVVSLIVGVAMLDFMLGLFMVMVIFLLWEWWRDEHK